MMTAAAEAQAFWDLLPSVATARNKEELEGMQETAEAPLLTTPPNKRRKSQSPRSTRSTGTASTATPPSRGTRTQRPAKRQTNADLETAVRLVAQMAIRQEDHSNLTRSDRAFVLHMANQTPGIIAPFLKVTKRWQEMREATPDQVRLPLRLAELQNTPAAMTAVRNQGRLNAENQWIIEKWSPALQRLVKDEQRTPMDFDRTVELLAKLKAGFQEPVTLLRCHATRAITENMTKPTTVFLIEVSLRGAKADELYDCVRLLCGHSALSLIGAQLRPEGMKRSPACQELQKILNRLRDR
ncbi:pol [Symbiodinium natans]|uniref:Pol protein n=1 Tax=Symbiodinium natans TaxID=878477 RepID=A0A812U2I0_9DINO|nr:pol [Symbiodinium natans]